MSLKLSSIINFSGIAADLGEWVRFARSLVLIIALPLLIVFLLAEYVGWHLGEDMAPEEAARRQTADPSLLWSTSSFDTIYRFKLDRLEHEKPVVMVLGHSRLGSLRGRMFEPYSFYNLSRPSWPFTAYTEMIKRLPQDSIPKVVIFNLDFFMFNQAYGNYYYAKASPNAEKSTWADHINMIRKSFMAVARNPLIVFADPADSVRKVPAIGLTSNIFGDGFRADGSESGHLIRPAIPPDIFKEVKWNNDPAFYYCDAMDPKEMAHLEEFVSAAHARGIALIGIQMPIYGPVLRAFEANPRYGILNDYRQHLASGYFDRLGIIALDLSDFPPYSDDPHYFGDAVHSTEVLAGAVMLKMESDPRVKALLPDLNTSDLQSKLQEDGQNAQFLSLYHD